jgi:GNAT superfamily N-acetyltransferase
MDAMSQMADDPPKNSGALSLRPMTLDDIPFGMELSRVAGWNQGEADWRMFLEHSTAGSYLATYAGVKAGTVTTVTYAGKLNWIGMVLVAPEFRRLGIGAGLLRAAIQAVKAQGAICLDATPAGKLLYDTLGFRDMYRLGRWQRPPDALKAQPVHACLKLYDGSFPALMAYDLPVFGADRAGILKTLCHNTPALAFYAEHRHKMVGYCLGRTGRQSVQIGPLVADRVDIGRDLLLGALHVCSHQPVIVDIPYQAPGMRESDSLSWSQSLQDLGFVEMRQFMRMSLGEFTFSEYHARQLAIAGPEIG